MIKTESKIDIKGIGDYVWELYTKNALSSYAVWQKVQAAGHDDITKSCVARYIKRRAREETDSLGDSFNKHVKEHLPNDLKALELIESASLTNTKITAKPLANKLAGQRRFVDHFQKHWALPLADAISNPKALKVLASEIISQCFDWVGEFTDWLKVHRAEREIALKAIDAKLKYSAVLKGSRGSKISIFRSSPDQKPVPEFKLGGKVVHLRKEHKDD